MNLTGKKRGNQTGKGQFQKGQSGNPGGVPRCVAVIRKLAEENTAEAFLRIVEIGRAGMETLNDNKPDSKLLGLALAANQYIVDRACGKPAQAVNLSDSEGGPLQISVIIKEKNAPGS